jgi:hypothetical protein
MLPAEFSVGRGSLSAAPHHGRDEIIAFGGFEVHDGVPVASNRVEGLAGHRSH